MIKGFKEFVMRGNVIDLAVAVVIGAAFAAVVTVIVDHLINPLIGLVFRADSLNNALVWEIGTTGAKIGFGAVIAALLNFLIVAAVVYFVFVLPMNKAKERAAARRASGEEDAPAPTEQELLTEIRDLLAKKS